MKQIICIVCPKGCPLTVDEETLAVTGNTCPRGEAYGREEVTNPTRTVTSTVAVRGGLYPRCPVKTDRPIPKHLIFEAMKTLDNVHLTAPVNVGQIVVENLCNTGANFVATRDL
ncbi:MAG: DUF1667 domain-containing protein [Oscillospiraceae bacterium]